MKVSKGKIQGTIEPKSEPALFSRSGVVGMRRLGEVASTVHQESRKRGRTLPSSLHFRIRRERRMSSRAAWPLTFDRVSQWWWLWLPCGRIRVSGHLSRCCRALRQGLPKRRWGAGRLCSAASAWALFPASSTVGLHRGRQRLQQLGGRSEAEVFLRLSRLCKHGEGTSPPAAGLAAQFIVSRNRAVPSQDLHLTEDGLVSVTRLIWKSKDTHSDDVMLKSDKRLETRAGVYDNVGMNSLEPKQ